MNLRKRLVIKEITNEHGETTHIQIVKQTHRYNEFGDNSNNFKYNGFEIYSILYPDLSSNELCVRGKETNHDNDIIPVYSQEWVVGMREAVSAYNKYFKGSCNTCTDRHCNECDLNKEIN